MELPAEPMLSTSVDHWELPADGTVAAEPKFDGYRALAGLLDDGAPVIRSRNGTDLTPGFPELAAALTDQLPASTLLDGEIVVWSGGRLVFDRLAGRLNRPPRVVALQAEREPASLIVFDVLHLGGTAVAPRPYAERRSVLEHLFASGVARPPLNLCPSTTQEATARAWIEQWAPLQIEGLVLKPTRGSYQPGRRRGGWRKWRLRDSREAVVGAVTGQLARPGIALLGRWDEQGRLKYLGRTARLGEGQARVLGAALRPAAADHPWQGKRFSAAWGSRETLDAVLVEPDVIAEVSVDISRVAGGGWRHSVRWLRLRPDLTPADLPLADDDT